MTYSTSSSIIKYCVSVWAGVSLHAQISVSGPSSSIQFDPHVLDQLRRSVVSIESITYTDSSSGNIYIGSGFIFDEEGFAVTRRSVVYNADEIKITLNDGRTVQAVVVYDNIETGLAILKLDGEKFTAITWEEDTVLDVPSCVTVIGNSLGVFPSVTMAMYWGINRYNLMKLGAVIPPGNSGSPVFNQQGQIVGMLVGRTRAQEENLQDHFIGLALPINQIVYEIESLMQYYKNYPSWVGLTVEDLPYNKGKVIITNIEQNSPAEKSGLTVGDTIVAFQGEALHNAMDLKLKVTQMFPQSEISMTIQKGTLHLNYIIMVQKRNWFPKR